jgi:hypothetical protein
MGAVILKLYPAALQLSAASGQTLGEAIRKRLATPIQLTLSVEQSTKASDQEAVVARRAWKSITSSLFVAVRCDTEAHAATVARVTIESSSVDSLDIRVG